MYKLCILTNIKNHIVPIKKMQQIPIRYFKESTSKKRFKILKIENEVFENDMIQELHRHTFFFALFLEKGSGEHIIDFKKYPIKNHSIFFMRPGQVHQITLKKGSSGYLVQFDKNFYAPTKKPSKFILRKVSYKNYCTLNSENFEKLLNILTSIHKEYVQKEKFYEEVIKAQLQTLFIKIVRQSKNPEKISKTESYSQEKLEEFFELIENNFSSRKKVAEYANMMSLSNFQLNKITKETLGKTSSQVLNDHILLEAKRNLLGTSNQINQIAYHLGYEDASYFIRFFKKNTGISPEKFRKNFK